MNNKYLEKIAGFNIAHNMALAGASAGYEFGSMGAKKEDKIGGSIAGAAAGALTGHRSGKLMQRYPHKINLPVMLGGLAVISGAGYASGKLYSKVKKDIKKK